MPSRFNQVHVFRCSVCTISRLSFGLYCSCFEWIVFLGGGDLNLSDFFLYQCSVKARDSEGGSRRRVLALNISLADWRTDGQGEAQTEMLAVWSASDRLWLLSAALQCLYSQHEISLFSFDMYMLVLFLNSRENIVSNITIVLTSNNSYNYLLKLLQNNACVCVSISVETVSAAVWGENTGEADCESV